MAELDNESCDNNGLKSVTTGQALTTDSLLRTRNEENYSFYENVLSLFPYLIRCLIIACKIILPVFLIIIGIRYRSDCGGSAVIPVCILVLGFLLGIKQLLVLTTFVRHSKEKQSEEINRQTRTQVIINLFIVGVFAILSYFVYIIYDPDPNKIFCNKNLFMTTFWIITLIYLIVIVGSIVLLIASIVILIFGKKKEETNN